MLVLLKGLWLVFSIPEQPDPLFLSEGFEALWDDTRKRIPTIAGGPLGTYRAAAIHTVNQALRPFVEWRDGSGVVPDYLNALSAVDTARAARSGPGGRRALREACRLRDALQPVAQQAWTDARNAVADWYGDTPDPQPVPVAPAPIGSW